MNFQLSTFNFQLLLPLLIGWLLDLVFGDPERLPHPVVYMGKWIAFWEKRLNRGGWRMTKGAVLAVASILLTGGVVWGIFRLADSCPQPWNSLIHIALGSVLVFFCLAGKTLRQEVRMVFQAAEEGEEKARRQVSRIVGRDTSQLSLQECRTAALETLAENLSDGVIAPLFWYALLGIPGMVAYKMVNTLDSMIGYHSERYIRFGCWAARIDDLANYIPARLTALLMLLVEVRNLPARIRFVLRYGSQHASPNSGWPEAALASILDCRFGGPHHYFGEYFYKPYIGTNERTFTFQDMQRALSVNLHAEILAAILVALVTYAR